MHNKEYIFEATLDCIMENTPDEDYVEITATSTSLKSIKYLEERLRDRIITSRIIEGEVLNQKNY